MDRIYYTYEHDVFLFKSWAKENGYICKLEQSSKSERLFEINGIPVRMELFTVLTKYRFDSYPYLDTFKYFNHINGQFSNSDNFRFSYKLVQSNGRLRKENSDEGHFQLDEDEYHDEDDWL